MPDTPPQAPLERGEFVEVVLRGQLRNPGGVGRLAGAIERFLGLRLGSKRWILLTNHRLLVLRRRSPAAYSGDDWFDVSLERATLRASMPFVEGTLVVMPLVSRLGPASMLLPQRSYREAVRLARAIGAVG
jgi:hypothetical protein